MRTLLFVLLLLSAAPAQAEDWPAADKALAGAAVALTVADWAQTRYIARNPAQWHELNPLLVEHPSVGRVDAYFAGALLGGAALSLALPAGGRRWFLVSAATLELIVVGRNARLGIRMDF